MTTQTPTRDPVGHTRALAEGAALLTPLGVLVAWLLTLLPVEVPEAVRTAIVGLVVTLGTVAFSEWRNRNHDLAQLGRSGAAIFWKPGLLLVFVLGCVTWDGAGFELLAAQEIPILAAADPAAELDSSRCASLRLAAVALRNEEGDSRSLNAPLLAGQHIRAVAGRYDRMASICYEMVDRDTARGVKPEVRGKLRADWLRAWRSGRALQGGPE